MRVSISDLREITDKQNVNRLHFDAFGRPNGSQLGLI